VLVEIGVISVGIILLLEVQYAMYYDARNWLSGFAGSTYTWVWLQMANLELMVSCIKPEETSEELKKQGNPE
jgi:hypothetical protein